MIRVLCFGDSNTWGAMPDRFGRYDEKTRYPKVLQSLLGDCFEVIEEGLCGRTVACDDYKKLVGNRNGVAYFWQAVSSHDPLDFIVVMLGTNDLKTVFDRNASDCARDLQEFYINFVNNSLSKIMLKVPKFIIVAPPQIDLDSYGKYEGAGEKSLHFNSEYKKICDNFDSCYFVDNDGLVAGADGLHMTKESHKLLAEKLAKLLLSI
ncbi:MAG: GDSL-type esterase/lipase family protein [Christensenellales bacterium]